MMLHEINITRFMRALFHKEYDGIDNWDDLWLQFIDNSGMGETRQAGLLTALHKIEVRLHFITAYVDYQFKFIGLTGLPATHVFNDLHKYGHRLIWSGDIEQFSIQLRRIDAKERRNKAEHDKLQKEYDTLQKTGKVKDDDRSRNDFVRMVNAISKHAGYRINKDDTDMEEFSLMIRSYNDEMKAIENQNNKN